METRRSFYPFLLLFSVAMFASCSSSVPKEGDIIEDSTFRSVDLRITEKTKGTMMSLGDLMESYEIIRLDNYVTDNYILLRPADVVSPVKLFTRKGRYVADIGGVGQGPGEYLYLFSWLVD